MSTALIRSSATDRAWRSEERRVGKECRARWGAAEDGIRDLYVTGVQTCALPISAAARSRSVLREDHAAVAERGRAAGPSPGARRHAVVEAVLLLRSRHLAR